MTIPLLGLIIDIEREPAGKTVSPQNGSSKMTAFLWLGAVIFKNAILQQKKPPGSVQPEGFFRGKRLV